MDSIFPKEPTLGQETGRLKQSARPGTAKRAKRTPAKEGSGFRHAPSETAEHRNPGRIVSTRILARRPDIVRLDRMLAKRPEFIGMITARGPRGRRDEAGGTGRQRPDVHLLERARRAEQRLGVGRARPAGAGGSRLRLDDSIAGPVCQPASSEQLVVRTGAPVPGFHREGPDWNDSSEPTTQVRPVGHVWTGVEPSPGHRPRRSVRRGWRQALPDTSLSKAATPTSSVSRPTTVTASGGRSASASPKSRRAAVSVAGNE